MRTAESVALRLTRVIAYQYERLAAAEMNRTGRSEHAAECQATEIEVTERPVP